MSKSTDPLSRWQIVEDGTLMHEAAEGTYRIAIPFLSARENGNDDKLIMKIGTLSSLLEHCGDFLR